MKKIYIFMLCIIIVLSLFGCKAKHNNDETAAIVIDNAASDSSNISQNNTVEEKDEIKNENSSVLKDNYNDILEKMTEQSDNDPSTVKTDDNHATVTTQNDAVVKSHQTVDVGTEPAVKNINDIQGCFTDIFVGKIIDTADVEVDYMPDIAIDSDSSFQLHTVEVEKTIWALSVTEKTTIKILHSDTDAGSLWCKPYTVGHSYIISGVIQPYNGQTVIIDVNSLSAEVDSEGNLTPMSAGAELVFKDIATLNDFINNTDMQRISKTIHPIPRAYTKAYNVEPYIYNFKDDMLVISPDHNETEENKSNREALIADLKKAIIANSDFKMPVGTQTEVK